MEVDSMHSAIEHTMEITNVYVPNDYHNIISSSRRGQPYTVVPLDHTDFFDFKNMTTKDTFVTDTEGRKVKWMNIRQIRYIKGDPNAVYIKYSFDEEFITVPVFPIRRRNRRGQADSAELCSPNKAYNSKLAISHAKKQDLLKMLDKQIIPQEYAAYYNNLPSAVIPHRLPEPDEDELD
jgi:hypothetical protein